MILNALRWLVLVLAALLVNAPVIATLVTSFKSPREIAANPGLWIREPTLENYAAVLKGTDRLDLVALLGNSLAVSLIGSLVALALALPASYAIVRGDFGRRALLPLVVNLRATPLIIFAIPIYMGFQWLGLLDTRTGLGLILAVVNLPLALVILVNALADLPAELDEAARMDGARSWQSLAWVLAPLMRPALATAFILGFITAWNEFLFGLMLTTTEAVPVTVGASFFFASAGGGVRWGLAAAVIVLAALPPTLLGLLAWRQIGRALPGGALKG
ncbi:carbohydrate ABC transporter permease [Amaricoccus sp.]|uniref:carbohydrate ABC transporter permease n=1 Tax=Amaricoccus sp. TaxID=1872485 RepID=UPI001B4A32C8|nr:carbohydrate ABC transporter permease [Amaricoccus sp.]MBP7003188.1 carbohydrate ABC transporter permease [Amaricoccus sp.]